MDAIQKEANRLIKKHGKKAALVISQEIENTTEPYTPEGQFYCFVTMKIKKANEIAETRT